MTQKDKLKDLITKYCNQQESRTFSLQSLNDAYGNYDIIRIGGKTPQNTVRRILQELRDEKFLSFLDNSGHYTLRGIDLLDVEKHDLGKITICEEKDLNKKEYIIETCVRNKKLIKETKEKFGYYCMIPDCNNSFLKTDRTPYIEVHHIIPLFQDGEDALWNLSVLCAHHHKMAHFAQENIIKDLQNELLEINKKYLK